MILGIDPGFRKLGYAIIDCDLNIVDGGILLSDKSKIKSDHSDNIYSHNQISNQKNTNPSSQTHTSQNPNRKRVHEVYIYFTKLLQEYQITKMVIEKLFFMEANKNNAEWVYAVRGILINLCMTQGIEVIELTPIQVKKYITGNGKAGKLLVQNIIQKIYKLQEMPEFNDTADALGLAYIGTKI